MNHAKALVTDFLPSLPHGRTGRRVDKRGHTGRREVGGQGLAPWNVGSVHATAPILGASGRGSQRLQVQKTCSVPSVSLHIGARLPAQSPVFPHCHGGHCLPPGPSPHCPGTRGLSRGTCSQRRTGPLTWCISPASQQSYMVHSTQFMEEESGPERRGWWVSPY